MRPVTRPNMRRIKGQTEVRWIGAGWIVLELRELEARLTLGTPAAFRLARMRVRRLLRMLARHRRFV